MGSGAGAGAEGIVDGAGAAVGIDEEAGVAAVDDSRATLARLKASRSGCRLCIITLIRGVQKKCVGGNRARVSVRVSAVPRGLTQLLHEHACRSPDKRPEAITGSNCKVGTTASQL